MKYLIPLIFFFATNYCLANMASPIQRESYPMSAVSSKDMDILNENIYIRIDKYFQRAFYKVEYTIQSDREGFQIPLLFHARDFLKNFKVWLDGKEVELKEFDYKEQDTSSKFDHFLSSREKNFRGNLIQAITIIHDENYHRQFPLSDFQYFEVDLSKGIHKIYVEYIGKSWVDNSDWVREYSFRYFLAPAKEWKSFHELNLSIDASAFDQPIHSNLGPPDSGSLKGTAHWKFSKIPADYIQITFSPKPNGFAKLLIFIGPTIISFIIILLIVILHRRLIRHAQKRFLKTVAVHFVVFGSLICPFFILFSFQFSYNFINWVIGEHAGGQKGGYIFFLVFLYVFLMPLYWLGMHRLNIAFKKQFASKPHGN